MGVETPPLKTETAMETIKGKEVIAYKYMNTNMCCSGFQYELGKTYKTDKVKLNEYGFHACLNPQDTFIFYSQGKNSRYFKVKLSGEITKCGMWDTNVAATEITILEEIDAYEILNIDEWWKSENVLDLLYFSDGFAQIINCERQYNFIGKDGKLLSDKWFEFADIFRDGFAEVYRTNGEQCKIDKNGKIVVSK